MAEVSTQPSMPPEPSPESSHSVEQEGHREPSYLWQGKALPVIQQEEEGGQGDRQLEPAPVGDGVGHTSKDH